MQGKFIKVETIAQAAMIISALQHLAKLSRSNCRYYNPNPVLWAEGLVKNGFTFVHIKGNCLSGYLDTPPDSREYKLTDLDKFTEDVIKDFATIRIPEGAEGAIKKAKSVKTSSGTVLIEGDKVTLPAKSLAISDIEDIVFAASN